MARIAGVDLPKDKRIEIGLTYVFGIGRVAAQAILKKAGVDGAIRVKDVSVALAHAKKMGATIYENGKVGPMELNIPKQIIIFFNKAR